MLQRPGKKGIVFKFVKLYSNSTKLLLNITQRKGGRMKNRSLTPSLFCHNSIIPKENMP